MKILILPDSFKGTLTAREAGEAMRRGAEACGHSAQVIPLSDGGEGFCDCYAALCTCEKVEVQTLGTYLQSVNTYYCKNGDTAVIESAAASGLCSRRDVLNATSYGTGTLIAHAVKNGCQKIVLGLGGTGCSDGGIGALYALGVRFFAEDMPYGIPKGCDMELADSFCTDGVLPQLQSVQFLYATDVTAPYCGRLGAAYVFAPQKGATHAQAEKLDNGLFHLASLLKQHTGKDVKDLPGAGAAGGLCGGLWALFGGEIQSGFDFLCRQADLPEKIRASDLVVTGEGKTDAQTRMGKLPWRVWQLCQKAKTPCWLLSGQIEGEPFGDRAAALCATGGDSAYTTTHAAECLENKMIKLLQSMPNLL